MIGFIELYWSLAAIVYLAYGCVVGIVLVLRAVFGDMNSTHWSWKLTRPKHKVLKVCNTITLPVSVFLCVVITVVANLVGGAIRRATS